MCDVYFLHLSSITACILCSIDVSLCTILIPFLFLLLYFLSYFLSAFLRIRINILLNSDQVHISNNLNSILYKSFASTELCCIFQPLCYYCPTNDFFIHYKHMETTLKLYFIQLSFKSDRRKKGYKQKMYIDIAFYI